ncbi:peptide-methionine (S)-S-oxide reductase MsrA [Streptomyces camelliae]|uniref:Peptide methionine sulfoxide reductase MsrA n=1 Tax=Streptomyces camelliae TaxID=3004093 RepID=A0ABY7P0Z7_9ACTN|nr:peptide-methionine (S)-S-oxide reductase MsrA [Streptomyces sp. HUAS 2-6]WBO64179.1 peptide-methionine (S)-S-oxide reductase MsrA [Streptomyces sp. HUAS 2-6]
MFFGRTPQLPTPEQALTGRPSLAYEVPDRHTVLGTPLLGPYPEGLEIADFGLGCFWGAERTFWRLPAGVYTTLVGYQGGYTEYPTYEEVCSGLTGHMEVVRVVYDPEVITYDRLLKTFWESHDPTQGFRQGNDVGTQYRSAIHTHTPEQATTAETSRTAYQKVLTSSGYGTITTEILPATDRPFYPAEAYHQQYLDKNPAGYCGLGGTGVKLSAPFETNWGASCPTGIASAPEVSEK